jgi:hypothetical protein
MIHSSRWRRRTHMLVFAASFAAAVGAHAEPIWQLDWSASAPPSFGPVTLEADAPLAFGPEGSMLFEARSPLAAPLFVRLDAAGQLDWSVELPLAATLAMIATADGGAYLLPYAASGEAQLVRVDPTGARTWSRSVPAKRLVEAGNGRVAASDTDWLTVPSAATGNMIWQRRINGDLLYYDTALSLAADSDGSLLRDHRRAS